MHRKEGAVHRKEAAVHRREAVVHGGRELKIKEINIPGPETLASHPARAS